MPDNEEELRPEDEEVQGGAVKSFLEHLEDLRWTIVKCAAVTLVTMGICLFGIHYLIAFLKWPIDRADLGKMIPNQVVTVCMGSNVLTTFETSTNRIGSIDLGTNHEVTVQVDSVRIGDHNVLEANVLPATENPAKKGIDLIYTDPTSPFFSSLHLAFFGGLILASPLVLYFVGQFLMPALKVREKKYFLYAFFIGVTLFLVGAFSAYYFIMPRAVQFTIYYSQNIMGIKTPFWHAETYISFLIKFMFGMGIGFELPVILLALVKIGVLDYAKLKSMRRYVIVANFILGAVLTTPEVFTQVIMAIVLQCLFEISVWIAWYWERQEKKRAASANLQLDV